MRRVARADDDLDPSIAFRDAFNRDERTNVRTAIGRHELNFMLMCEVTDCRGQAAARSHRMTNSIGLSSRCFTRMCTVPCGD